MDILIIENSYGITELKGIPVVSSRYIADKFEKRHTDVLRSIENITEYESGISPEFRKRNFALSYYREGKGKYKEYLLTKDGFVIVVMGFTGKKAMRFKEEYIDAFNNMELYIKEIQEAKLDFPEFTDAIMLAHEEPKQYHFSNELNMINQIVTGMTAKQFKDLHNLGNVPSIRPYLDFEQLEAVKKLQRIDIGLIISVPDYQERRQMLTNYFNRMKIKQIGA